VTSDQGNQKIRELGIPVVVLGIGQNTTDTLLKEFKMIGHILGTEKEATELIDYWGKKLELIKQKTTSVPEDKKKRVFYTSSGLPFRTDGKLWWGHYFIETAGGINVSRELGSSGEITPEQLLLWNPDFIITSINKNNRSSTDEIRKNLKIKNVKAIKNNAVYPCPIGAFWWDRPSPEAILGIIWLPGVLYPDLMTDIDLETETIHFFKQFYKYDLSKQEYNVFFNTGKIRE
ncbi:MAG: ABC transporter substrate-binding protein, partial [Deltaproteobacteria bacterium]|nr:ABC transporter substrate-binding protein [Deltaproteobacteria bacterium]